MGQTLFIIKPDAIEDRHVGAIISILERNGIVIKRIKMETLTRKRAEDLYNVHRGKPFYEKLVKFMMSGPVIEMILEHENCIEYIREIIGATDPQKAAEGTIRRLFARNLTENAVHASDSIENARKEITCIFDELKSLN